MSDLLDLLIVEDEAATRLLLCQIFRNQGFNVQTAEDGLAALRIIRSSPPDVLLSDLHMPVMSGFELLSVVSRLYPQIHVVAMSGGFFGSAIPKGLPADSFYEKGTGITPLIELIQAGTKCEHASCCAHRKSTPMWVALESRLKGQTERHPASDSDAVLVTCPGCLRPLRFVVDAVNSDVRETSCGYCGGQIAYAIAMAVQPASGFTSARVETLTVSSRVTVRR